MLLLRLLCCQPSSKTLLALLASLTLAASVVFVALVIYTDQEEQEGVMPARNHDEKVPEQAVQPALQDLTVFSSGIGYEVALV